LQDVFLKIWEIRERIDPDLSFRGYLYRICRNSVFKLMKQMASDETLRLGVIRQFSQSVSDADLRIHWQQYEAILRASVQALPPQRQKVFLLCREQGKTYEQVAAELGISRNTVKEHMVMAMRSISDYFRQYGNTPAGFILLVLLYSDLYK
jgi:RNA polymerase sigma factor (sigma-70 family)